MMWVSMKAMTRLGSLGVAIAMASVLLVVAGPGCGSDDQSPADDLPGGTDYLTGDEGDIKAEDADTSSPGEDIGLDRGPQDATCGSCTGGKICYDGECRCPATQKDCNGICTTMGTNEDCSDCGDVCPTGGSCQAGRCVCPSGQVDCDGVCVELGTDANCSDCGDACVGTKKCTNKKCVAQVDPECLPTVPCVSDDDCVSGNRCNQAITPPACQKLYCGGFGTACSEDYFCLSMLCDDEACNHDCSGLECGADPVYGESCGICQQGAKCVSNHCVCDPEDHVECVAGNVTWIDSCGNVGAVKEGCPLACLGGECVDCEAVAKFDCSGTCTLLGTDTNCSECSDVCTGGKGCEDGMCQCPAGQADCSGTCTLLGTDTNCSGCGDVCTGGKECKDGSCQCPIGRADCSGTCTFLGTNENCSECGDVCTGGKGCEDGMCQCPAGQTDCSGTCTLLGTDTNCSECGDVCAGGKGCEGGSCKCAVGKEDCAGVCTLLGTNANCSECGDECPEQGTCNNGICLGGCVAFPTTWGPASAVNYLSVIATYESASKCFDYSGDGVGDSSIAKMASQVNDALADALADAPVPVMGAVFEFPSMANYSESSPFVLAGLKGLDDGSVSSVVPLAVSQISYSSYCAPINQFRDARIAGGRLTASSDSIWIENLLLGGTTDLLLRLHDARIEATVVEGGQEGVVLDSGVLSGIIIKDEAEALLDTLEANCSLAPDGEKPDYCGYLAIQRQLLDYLCDLHQDENGSYSVADDEHPANAISVCFGFRTTKARIQNVVQ